MKTRNKLCGRAEVRQIGSIGIQLAPGARRHTPKTLFLHPALMFAVKGLDAAHHPGFAQTLISEKRPRRAAGPKTTVEQALMRGLDTA
jgi:hypothetical protein